MKKLLISIVLVGTVLFTVGHSLNLKKLDLQFSTVGSMNTLRLGQRDKNLNELAKTIRPFDVIALQEVMNKTVMLQLEKEIETLTKIDWDYYISNKAVGVPSHKEYYAFMWRTDKVELVKALGFYPEKQDSDFIREPFGVIFKIGEADITLVSCHIIFGDRKSDRRAETSKLYDVYNYFQTINGTENDVFLVGDFNMDGQDKSFNTLKAFDDIQNGFDKTALTSINKAGELVNAYDNIFFTRYSKMEMELTFIMNHVLRPLRRYRQEVSDHLPVGMVIKIDRDDD